MSKLFARHALLPDGWAKDVLIEWDAAAASRRSRRRGQRLAALSAWSTRCPA
jgi:hypothetical protein